MLPERALAGRKPRSADPDPESKVAEPGPAGSCWDPGTPSKTEGGERAYGRKTHARAMFRETIKNKSGPLRGGRGRPGGPLSARDALTLRVGGWSAGAGSLDTAAIVTPKHIWSYR